jgi:hypothetical protein
VATRSKSTYQKRQKEMKRQEKQRMKAERRAQRNLAKRAEAQAPNEITLGPAESETHGDWQQSQ